MDSNSVTLPSDDEGTEDCLPKIINTISLQGCSELSSFNEESQNERVEDLLDPKYEIKEEKSENEVVRIEFSENGISHVANAKEGNNEIKKEKKRLKLTQLSPSRRDKPSTSRWDDHNIVDTKRLALQESLFKTKELFDTFLRVCQDHENTEQMERVVQKLSRAYGVTKQEFLGSPTFQNILEAETEKVNTSNTKPWLNLKLVLDELKHNKKTVGNKLKLGESEESQDAGGSNDDEPVIECPKKRRHLKKLEKVLRAVNLKIKKLEEREVDWDEEDNSAYCKLDRYRSQFTKIYTKICEIKGKLPDADRPYLRKVSFAGTTYPHINRCIEKFYNKHREFPDFQDIKKLVTLALKQEGIEMAPIKIHAMAAAAFKEFGEMLKRLRQYDDYDVLISYLEQQVDPARNNEQLQEQLNMNALLFKKREQEVLDKFVDRENQGGVCTESEDDSDSEPKKKKMRIIIKDPNLKKKLEPTTPNNQNLLNSDSSGEEDEDKVKRSVVGLSSDSDISGSESKGKVEKSVKGKGKALVGKQRIVKRGVVKSSSNKCQKPKTAISSDEENAPENTKESLTSYLGLQGTSSKSGETKESGSEDEIKCIDEVKRPLKEVRGMKRNVLSYKSKVDQAVKDKSDVKKKTDIKSENRNSSKSASKENKEEHNKINTVTDSDSDIEPVVKKPKRSTPANRRKSINQARKSTAPRTQTAVPTKRVVDTKRINLHETISDSSESESRTSDEKSESHARKKVKGVKLNNDEETRKKKDEKDADDAIIILSEDIVEETKQTAPKQNPSKLPVDSSDSDDVCILSQPETERRTVAPRRTKPNVTALTSSFRSQQRAGVATSTPSKSLAVKRRLSSQSNNGNNTQTRKPNVTTNGSGRQTILPQVINGACRKVIINRVQKSTSSSSSTSTPEPIPLIELD